MAFRLCLLLGLVLTRVHPCPSVVKNGLAEFALRDARLYVLFLQCIHAYR